MQLLLNSATAGDAHAQLALAVRYANGDGVHRSYPEAWKWFTRAESQGVTPSDSKSAEAKRKVEQWIKKTQPKQSFQ
jgi:TPR repeat protein